MRTIEIEWPEELSADRLRHLADEVSRVRNALSRAARVGHEPITGSFVRSIIRARRTRSHFLDGDLFADPAWDMLLDLFAARLEGCRVSVSSLCGAADVPPTTALRWISGLQARGYVRRVPDEQDARRIFVELTDATAEKMQDCLLTAQAASPLLM